MRRKTVILGIICLLFIIQSAFSQDISRDYRIGPKDLLEIRVIGQDDASATVRVSEDGNITMPYLGEVLASGMTKAALEKNLIDLFDKRGIFHTPQVTVFIREYKSNIVSIIGAVKNPGEYELIGRLTLMDLIAKAGGPTGEEGKEIIIYRRMDGTSDSLKIPRDGLLDEGDPDLNVPLQPGDVINFPIDRIVPIYVKGQVRNPGMLEVKRSELPNFTVTKAIAQAGGFSERASKGSVKILRINAKGEQEIIKVNVKSIEKGKRPDFKLQEGDVIIVPEGIF